MTRIDHERNGRPAPPEDGDAPEAPEQPIERVRPVTVPGAVAGARRAEPPADEDTRITSRWQSVRLRLGEGADARPATAASRIPPDEGEPSTLRRYRVPLGLVVAGVATAAVAAALAAGGDHGAGPTPPPVQRTPPVLSSGNLVPLNSASAAGGATAGALLTGSGGHLELTLRADVPGRPYLVGLVGPHGTKSVLASHGGASAHTLAVSWRQLAKYDRLALYAAPTGGSGAAASAGHTSGKHHAAGKGAAAKHHAQAHHAAAKHHSKSHHAAAGGHAKAHHSATGRHHAAASGHAKAHHSATGKHHGAAKHHATAKHHAAAKHARGTHSTRPKHNTPILSISVDQLVRASGVHVAG